LRVPVDTNSLNYTNDGKLTIDQVDINQVSGLSAALAAKADTTSAASSSVKMANNLSDLTSPATARTNLGLGSLATASSISYADISSSAAIADFKLGTIATAGKVSGSAITSGTISGTTDFNSSGSITSTGNIVVNGTGTATTELRFNDNDNDNSNYVGFKSPGIVSTVIPDRRGPTCLTILESFWLNYVVSSSRLGARNLRSGFMSSLVFEIIILTSASTALVSLCLKFNIPSIVGFILTGMVVGPHGLGLVATLPDVRTLTEWVGMLLMFTIGLEFNRQKLLELKHQFLHLGPAQVLGTVFLTSAFVFVGT
jgi:hypothetical protein